MNIFVIMPFHSEFDAVYGDLIKAPLEENGHTVNRADDVATHQSILRNIIQNISGADLVVADLTAQNANVYYELGLAHALRKDTVQIVQDLNDVPFDLRSHNVIVYSVRFGEAEQLHLRILDVIERATKGSYMYSNPIIESEISFGVPNDLIQSNISSDTGKGLEEDKFEMGVLDAIVAAEDSTDEMTFVATEIAEQFGVLAEKIQANTDRINRLNANPNQKGLNSKRLQVARQFAADVNLFSERVEETIPTLRTSWESVDQGVGHFISFNRIKNSEELVAIRKLVDTIHTVRIGLGENRNVFGSFRESQNQLRGLSRATDRALTNSDRTLQRLDNEFELGESVLGRIIDLAGLMIDRYLTCKLNNEDESADTPVET